MTTVSVVALAIGVVLAGAGLSLIPPVGFYMESDVQPREPRRAKVGWVMLLVGVILILSSLGWFMWQFRL